MNIAVICRFPDLDMVVVCGHGFFSQVPDLGMVVVYGHGCFSQVSRYGSSIWTWLFFTGFQI